MYIRYCFPYSTDGKLGQAYNREFLTVGDDDWICFKDADVMILTPNYGHYIAEKIAKYPDTSVFTCFTNRIGTREQRYPDMFEERDLAKHKSRAETVHLQSYGSVTRIKVPISGMLMIVSKRAWKKVKFKEEGILKVDKDFSRRILQAGMIIRRLDGLYVLHYYRLNEGIKNKTHLK